MPGRAGSAAVPPAAGAGESERGVPVGVGVSLLLWLSAGSGHGTRSHALALAHNRARCCHRPPPADRPRPPTGAAAGTRRLSGARSRLGRRDRRERAAPSPGSAAPRISRLSRPRVARVPRPGERRGSSAEQQNPELLRGTRTQAEVKPRRSLSGGTEPLPGADCGRGAALGAAGGTDPAVPSFGEQRLHPSLFSAAALHPWAS